MTDPAYLRSAVHFASQLAVLRDQDEAVAVAAATYSRHGVTPDQIGTEWCRQLITSPVVGSCEP